MVLYPRKKPVKLIVLVGDKAVACGFGKINVRNEQKDREYKPVKRYQRFVLIDAEA